MSMTKQRGIRYPFRVTHQTAQGRQEEYFETAEEYEAFLKVNRQWVTSYSTPENYKK